MVLRAWGLMDGDEVTEVGEAVTGEGFVGQEEDPEIDSVVDRKPVELREHEMIWADFWFW